MIIWAKKTFWIHRSTQDVLEEFSVNDKPSAYMSFIKDCPYELTELITHNIISDYLKPMVISHEKVDLLFYPNGIYIGKMRDRKIDELHKD